MLDLGLDLDIWPWVWLFVAVAFAIIELTILGGSFILLPFAVSAFFASILGFYDVSIEVQWAVFVFGGGLLWVGFYRWSKTFLRDHDLPPGVGAERLVGRTGVITVDVSPDADAVSRFLGLVGRDAALRRKQTINVALDYLGAGLDPEHAILYRQSDVPEGGAVKFMSSTGID